MKKKSQLYLLNTM